jgi:fibronectin type 3 domain-containing protein
VTVITPEGKPSIEVPGDDSPDVKVFANDIFPPAVPSGLQAAASGPGQPPFVDLIWAPDSEADLAGYRVYRRVNNGQILKLNSELVKTPAYRDTNVVPGKTYSYSVSAVDIRGNESARSEEVSETAPQS